MKGRCKHGLWREGGEERTHIHTQTYTHTERCMRGARKGGKRELPVGWSHTKLLQGSSRHH
eukprot:1162051-Pelagomonas_calceolata.AAC.8